MNYQTVYGDKSLIRFDNGPNLTINTRVIVPFLVKNAVYHRDNIFEEIITKFTWYVYGTISQLSLIIG